MSGSSSLSGWVWRYSVVGKSDWKEKHWRKRYVTVDQKDMCFFKGMQQADSGRPCQLVRFDKSSGLTVYSSQQTDFAFSSDGYNYFVGLKYSEEGSTAPLLLLLRCLDQEMHKQWVAFFSSFVPSEQFNVIKKQFPTFDVVALEQSQEAVSDDEASSSDDDEMRDMISAFVTEVDQPAQRNVTASAQANIEAAKKRLLKERATAPAQGQVSGVSGLKEKLAALKARNQGAKLVPELEGAGGADDSARRMSLIEDPASPIETESTAPRSRLEEAVSRKRLERKQSGDIARKIQGLTDRLDRDVEMDDGDDKDDSTQAGSSAAASVSAASLEKRARLLAKAKEARARKMTENGTQTDESQSSDMPASAAPAAALTEMEERFQDATARAQAAEAEAETLNERLETEQTQLQDVRKRCQSITAERDEAREKLFNTESAASTASQQLKDAVAAVTAERDEAQRAQAEAEQGRADLQVQVEAQQGEVEALKAAASSQEGELGQRVQQLEGELQEATQKLSEATSACAEAESRSEQRAEEAEGLQKKLDESAQAQEAQLAEARAALSEESQRRHKAEDDFTARDTELSELQARISDLSTRLEEKQVELAAATHSEEETQEELRGSRAQAEALQGSLDEARSELAKLAEGNSQLEVLTEQMAERTAQRDALQAEVASAQGLLEAKAAEAQEASAALATAEAAAAQELQAARDDLASAREEVGQLTKDSEQLQGLQAQLADLQGEAAAQKQGLEEASAAAREQDARAGELQAKLEEARGEVEKLSSGGDQVALLSDKVSRLEEEKGAGAQALRDAEAALAAAEAERDRLRQDVEAARNEPLRSMLESTAHVVERMSEICTDSETDALHSELDILKGSLDQCSTDDDRQELALKIKALQSRVEESSKSHTDTELQERVDSAAMEQDVYDGDFADQAAGWKEVSRRLLSEKRALEEQLEGAGGASERVSELEGELQAAKDSAVALQAELEQKEQAGTGADERVEGLRDDLAAAEAQLETQRQAVAAAERRADELQAAQSSAQEDEEKGAPEESETLRQELAACKTRIEELEKLQADTPDTAAQLAASVEERQAAVTEAEALRQEVEACNERLAETADAAAQLEQATEERQAAVAEAEALRQEVAAAKESRTEEVAADALRDELSACKARIEELEQQGTKLRVEEVHHHDADTAAATPPEAGQTLEVHHTDTEATEAETLREEVHHYKERLEAAEKLAAITPASDPHRVVCCGLRAALLACPADVPEAGVLRDLPAEGDVGPLYAACSAALQALKEAESDADLTACVLHHAVYESLDSVARETGLSGEQLLQEAWARVSVSRQPEAVPSREADDVAADRIRSLENNMQGMSDEISELEDALVKERSRADTALQQAQQERDTLVAQLATSGSEEDLATARRLQQALGDYLGDEERSAAATPEQRGRATSLVDMAVSEDAVELRGQLADLREMCQELGVQDPNADAVDAWREVARKLLAEKRELQGVLDGVQKSEDVPQATRDHLRDACCGGSEPDLQRAESMQDTLAAVQDDPAFDRLSADDQAAVVKAVETELDGDDAAALREQTDAIEDTVLRVRNSSVFSEGALQPEVQESLAEQDTWKEVARRLLAEKKELQDEVDALRESGAAEALDPELRARVNSVGTHGPRERALHLQVTLRAALAAAGSELPDEHRADLERLASMEIEDAIVQDQITELEAGLASLKGTAAQPLLPAEVQAAVDTVSQKVVVEQEHVHLQQKVEDLQREVERLEEKRVALQREEGPALETLHESIVAVSESAAAEGLPLEQQQRLSRAASLAISEVPSTRAEQLQELREVAAEINATDASAELAESVRENLEAAEGWKEVSRRLLQEKQDLQAQVDELETKLAERQEGEGVEPKVAEDGAASLQQTLKTVLEEHGDKLTEEQRAQLDKLVQEELSSDPEVRAQQLAELQRVATELRDSEQGSVLPDSLREELGDAEAAEGWKEVSRRLLQEKQNLQAQVDALEAKAAERGTDGQQGDDSTAASLQQTLKTVLEEHGDKLTEEQRAQLDKLVQEELSSDPEVRAQQLAELQRVATELRDSEQGSVLPDSLREELGDAEGWKEVSRRLLQEKQGLQAQVDELEAKLAERLKEVDALEAEASQLRSAQPSPADPLDTLRACLKGDDLSHEQRAEAERLLTEGLSDDPDQRAQQLHDIHRITQELRAPSAATATPSIQPVAAAPTATTPASTGLAEPAPTTPGTGAACLPVPLLGRIEALLAKPSEERDAADLEALLQDLSSLPQAAPAPGSDEAAVLREQLAELRKAVMDSTDILSDSAHSHVTAESLARQAEHMQGALREVQEGASQHLHQSLRDMIAESVGEPISEDRAHLRRQHSQLHHAVLGVLQSDSVCEHLSPALLDRLQLLADTADAMDCDDPEMLQQQIDELLQALLAVQDSATSNLPEHLQQMLRDAKGGGRHRLGKRPSSAADTLSHRHHDDETEDAALPDGSAPLRDAVAELLRDPNALHLPGVLLERLAHVTGSDTAPLKARVQALQDSLRSCAEKDDPLGIAEQTLSSSPLVLQEQLKQLQRVALSVPPGDPNLPAALRAECAAQQQHDTQQLRDAAAAAATSPDIPAPLRDRLRQASLPESLQSQGTAPLREALAEVAELPGPLPQAVRDAALPAAEGRSAEALMQHEAELARLHAELDEARAACAMERLVPLTATTAWVQEVPEAKRREIEQLLAAGDPDSLQRAALLAMELPQLREGGDSLAGRVEALSRRRAGSVVSVKVHEADAQQQALACLEAAPELQQLSPEASARLPELIAAEPSDPATQAALSRQASELLSSGLALPADVVAGLSGRRGSWHGLRKRRQQEKDLSAQVMATARESDALREVEALQQALCAVVCGEAGALLDEACRSTLQGLVDADPAPAQAARLREAAAEVLASEAAARLTPRERDGLETPSQQPCLWKHVVWRLRADRRERAAPPQPDHDVEAAQLLEAVAAWLVHPSSAGSSLRAQAEGLVVQGAGAPLAELRKLAALVKVSEQYSGKPDELEATLSHADSWKGVAAELVETQGEIQTELARERASKAIEGQQSIDAVRASLRAVLDTATLTERQRAELEALVDDTHDADVSPQQLLHNLSVAAQAVSLETRSGAMPGTTPDTWKAVSERLMEEKRELAAEVDAMKAQLPRGGAPSHPESDTGLTEIAGLLEEKHELERRVEELAAARDAGSGGAADGAHWQSLALRLRSEKAELEEKLAAVSTVDETGRKREELRLLLKRVVESPAARSLPPDERSRLESLARDGSDIVTLSEAVAALGGHPEMLNALPADVQKAVKGAALDSASPLRCKQRVGELEGSLHQLLGAIGQLETEIDKDNTYNTAVDIQDALAEAAQCSSLPVALQRRLQELAAMPISHDEAEAAVQLDTLKEMARRLGSNSALPQRLRDSLAFLGDNAGSELQMQVASLKHALVAAADASSKEAYPNASEPAAVAALHAVLASGEELPEALRKQIADALSGAAVVEGPVAAKAGRVEEPVFSDKDSVAELEAILREKERVISALELELEGVSTTSPARQGGAHQRAAALRDAIAHALEQGHDVPPGIRSQVRSLLTKNLGAMSPEELHACLGSLRAVGDALLGCGSLPQGVAAGLREAMRHPPPPTPPPPALERPVSVPSVPAPPAAVVQKSDTDTKSMSLHTQDSDISFVEKLGGRVQLLENGVKAVLDSTVAASINPSLHYQLASLVNRPTDRPPAADLGTGATEDEVVALKLRIAEMDARAHVLEGHAERSRAVLARMKEVAKIPGMPEESRRLINAAIASDAAMLAASSALAEDRAAERSKVTDLESQVAELNDALASVMNCPAADQLPEGLRRRVMMLGKGKGAATPITDHVKDLQDTMTAVAAAPAADMFPEWLLRRLERLIQDTSAERTDVLLRTLERLESKVQHLEGSGGRVDNLLGTLQGIRTAPAPLPEEARHAVDSLLAADVAAAQRLLRETEASRGASLSASPGEAGAAALTALLRVIESKFHSSEGSAVQLAEASTAASGLCNSPGVVGLTMNAVASLTHDALSSMRTRAGLPHALQLISSALRLAEGAASVAATARSTAAALSLGSHTGQLSAHDMSTLANRLYKESKQLPPECSSQIIQLTKDLRQASTEDMSAAALKKLAAAAAAVAGHGELGVRVASVPSVLPEFEMASELRRRAIDLRAAGAPPAGTAALDLVVKMLETGDASVMWQALPAAAVAAVPVAAAPATAAGTPAARPAAPPLVGGSAYLASAPAPAAPPTPPQAADTLYHMQGAVLSTAASDAPSPSLHGFPGPAAAVPPEPPRGLELFGISSSVTHAQAQAAQGAWAGLDPSVAKAVRESLKKEAGLPEDARSQLAESVGASEGRVGPIADTVQSLLQRDDLKPAARTLLEDVANEADAKASQLAAGIAALLRGRIVESRPAECLLQGMQKADQQLRELLAIVQRCSHDACVPPDVQRILSDAAADTEGTLVTAARIAMRDGSLAEQTRRVLKASLRSGNGIDVAIDAALSCSGLARGTVRALRETLAAHRSPLPNAALLLPFVHISIPHAARRAARMCQQPSSTMLDTALDMARDRAATMERAINEALQMVGTSDAAREHLLHLVSPDVEDDDGDGFEPTNAGDLAQPSIREGVMSVLGSTGPSDMSQVLRKRLEEMVGVRTPQARELPGASKGRTQVVVLEPPGEGEWLDCVVEAPLANGGYRVRVAPLPTSHPGTRFGGKKLAVSQEHLRVVFDSLDKPALGAKVQRNPKVWKWGEQDGGPGSTGTVVENDEEEWVAVLWDLTARRSRYRWGFDNAYDVLEIDAHPLTVGARVCVSGGAKQGTVQSKEPGFVVVRWDNGTVHRHRWGSEGEFDISLLDPACPDGDALRALLRGVLRGPEADTLSEIARLRLEALLGPGSPHGKVTRDLQTMLTDLHVLTPPAPPLEQPPLPTALPAAPAASSGTHAHTWCTEALGLLRDISDGTVVARGHHWVLLTPDLSQKLKTFIARPLPAGDSLAQAESLPAAMKLLLSQATGDSVLQALREVLDTRDTHLAQQIRGLGTRMPVHHVDDGAMHALIATEAASVQAVPETRSVGVSADLSDSLARRLETERVKVKELQAELASSSSSVHRSRSGGRTAKVVSPTRTTSPQRAESDAGEPEVAKALKELTLMTSHSDDRRRGRTVNDAWVDQVVEETLADPSVKGILPHNFGRDEMGSVRFGTRKIDLVAINEFASVRIGGGYMLFSDFVKRFADTERRKLVINKEPSADPVALVRSGRDMLFVDQAEEGDPQRVLSRATGPAGGARPESPRRVRRAREDITLETERPEWTGINDRRRRPATSGPLPERLSERSRSGSRANTPARARSPSWDSVGRRFLETVPAADTPMQWAGKAAPMPPAAAAPPPPLLSSAVLEEEELSDDTAPAPPIVPRRYDTSLDVLEARLQHALDGARGRSTSPHSATSSRYLRDPRLPSQSPAGGAPAPVPVAPLTSAHLGPMSRAFDESGRKGYRLATHPVHDDAPSSVVDYDTYMQAHVTPSRSRDGRKMSRPPPHPGMSMM